MNFKNCNSSCSLIIKILKSFPILKMDGAYLIPKTTFEREYCPYVDFECLNMENDF